MTFVNSKTPPKFLVIPLLQPRQATDAPVHATFDWKLVISQIIYVFRLFSSFVEECEGLRFMILTRSSLACGGKVRIGATRLGF